MITKPWKLIEKHPLSSSIFAASALAFVSPLALSQADDHFNFALEEIVVTAQKREQSMQEVPIAVTAMDADALKASAVNDVSDLNNATPSFHINIQHNKVASSPMRIRGIGTTGTNAAFEGAVGVYIDGVYRSRPGMAMSTFNDIGMLQVLRGPQGTLFGKNTSAGALVLDSIAPSDEFEASIEASVGNYDQQDISVLVNGAVSENLALRASLVSVERDGYWDNPHTGNNTTNVDTDSIKLQALYTPTDEVSVRVIADYSESDELCCYGRSGRRNYQADVATGESIAQSVNLGINSGLDLPLLNPAFSGLTTRQILGLPSDFVFSSPNRETVYSTLTNGAPYYDVVGNATNRLSPQNEDASDQTEDWGISFDVSYDLNEDMTLRSVTSYREYTNEQLNSDLDFSPVDIGEDQEILFEFETFSQEFNLSGTFELRDVGVEYVLGAFYTNEDMFYDHRMGLGSAFGGVQASNLLEVAAASYLGGDPDTGFVFLNGSLLPQEALSRPGAATRDGVMDHNDEVQAYYGHFTFALTEDLNLIAGIRYSEETKTLDRYSHYNNGTPLDALNHLINEVGLGIFFIDGASTDGPNASYSISEQEWTYTLGIQYFLNQGTQLYANYSRGYKAGGIDLNNDAGGELIGAGNLPLIMANINDILTAYATGTEFNFPEGTPVSITNPAPATYDPEFVDAYELGMKMDYQSGRGRLNVALFRSEYEDIQANSFTGLAFLTYNADTAVTQGIEIENTYALTESLTTNIAITWLDEVAFGDDQPAEAEFLAGRDIELAADVSAVLGLRYQNEITDGVLLYGNLNLSYTGDHLLSNDQDVSEQYSTVGASVGLRMMDDRLNIQLSCANCSDEEYFTNAFASPVLGFGILGEQPIMGNLGAPRTYQLTIGYRWD